MDDQAYLEPGFDPASLTMPRLRSILVAHNVAYPASAKKQVLLDIFHTQVLPHARKLRNASARVKRTTRGIENVPSLDSQSTTTSTLEEEEEEEAREREREDRDDDDDDDQKAPTAPSTGRISRRTTRARTEEAQEVRPTPRAVRHGTAPPQHTPRPSSIKHADEEHNDTNFSNENVFQSRTSPPAPPSRDPDRRRTTGAASRDRHAERRRTEARRRTEDFQPPQRHRMDGAARPTRSIFEAPVARVPADAEVEPTEEFTPEEERERVRARQSGELVPATPTPRRPASNAAKTAPVAILGAMLMGLWGAYRQEKVQVGYCGVGTPSTEIAGVQIPEWADILRPQCDPCPQHAYCGEHLETHCEPGFLLTPHPLSFGGVVPLAPSCEPDGAKARKVGAVKQRAVAELREQNAKYECGEASTPDVKEPELKKAIASKRRKNMSNEEFEDLWSSALGEIHNAEEVTTGADGNGNFILRSHSLARLPLACAVRRSLREALGRYFGQIVGLLLLLSAGTYTRYQITYNRETERKAEELASEALEILRNQASWHAYDPQTYGEGFLGVSQLRDDVLRREFSATRRKRVWERVQQKVEGNSNVRPMVREGRRGDVGRVWEWVGAVGMIEDTPERGDGHAGGGGGGRVGKSRKSGNRVSFGGVMGEEKLIESRDGSEIEGVKKWEEGRPYY